MGPQGRILLAEDDIDLCSMMVEFFAVHGFSVEPSHNGRDAAKVALAGGFDLVILDVMMPVIDGFEVLRQIRRRSSVPVIMLTARTAPADRIEGLNTGADDYLPKPFAPDELLARVRAVLRRTGGSSLPSALSSGAVQCGSLKLHSGTREVSVRGLTVSLTNIEFDLLECLLRSAGRVVTRDALTASLHQREVNPFERSLDVHISHLRRKIEDTGEKFIHTIRGTGYMLSAPNAESHEARS
jgi:two-component system response regulator CpxR